MYAPNVPIKGRPMTRRPHAPDSMTHAQAMVQFRMMCAALDNLDHLTPQWVIGRFKLTEKEAREALAQIRKGRAERANGKPF